MQHSGSCAKLTVACMQPNRWLCDLQANSNEPPEPPKPEAAPKKEAPKPKKEAEAPKTVLQLQDGRFVDHRWENGRWTLSKFANPATGEMDWPAWNSVRLSILCFRCC